MISTMVANRLSKGPVEKRTTRPTSTSLHWLSVISASPISTDKSVSAGQKLVDLALIEAFHVRSEVEGDAEVGR